MTVVRRRIGRASGRASLAAIMTIGQPALAAVPLEWEAPPSCPSAPQVQAWVDALVDARASGRAEGEVAEAAGEYRLALVVTTPQGRLERTLRAPACESLARAAAVVVAVAVDPVEAQARTDVDRPPPMVATRTEPSRAMSGDGDRSVPTDRPVEPAAVREGSRRPRAATVGVAAGAGAGLLPQPHATVHAWGGLAWRWLEGQVIATHRFGRLAERPGGGGASISATTGGLALGPAVRHGRWGLRILAVLEAGAMVGDGRGLMHPRTAVSPWLGLGLQPGLSWWPAAWVGLRMDATLSGSLLQPQFEIEGGPLIHRASLLSARVALGVEFRIPLDQAGRGRGPRG